MPPRTWLLTALTVATLACRKPESPAPGPVPELPRSAPTFRTVAIPPDHSPDPNYRPRPGDRAILWKFFPEGTGSPVAADRFAFGEMVKFLEARDIDGLKDQAGTGRVALVPMGAEVLVLAVQGDPDHPRDTDPVQVRVFHTAGESLQVWTPRICVVRFTRMP